MLGDSSPMIPAAATAIAGRADGHAIMAHTKKGLPAAASDEDLAARSRVQKFLLDAPTGYSSSGNPFRR